MNPQAGSSDDGIEDIDVCSLCCVRIAVDNLMMRIQSDWDFPEGDLSAMNLSYEEPGKHALRFLLQWVPNLVVSHHYMRPYHHRGKRRHDLSVCYIPWKAKRGITVIRTLREVLYYWKTSKTNRQRPLQTQ